MAKIITLHLYRLGKLRALTLHLLILQNKLHQTQEIYHFKFKNPAINFVGLFLHEYKRQNFTNSICNYSSYTNLFSKYLIMSEAEYNSLTIVELHALAEEIRIKLSYDPKKTEREKLMVKLATIELNIDQRFLDL